MFVPLVGDGHIPILFSYIQGTFSGLGCSSLMSSMVFSPETGCLSLDFRILTLDILSMSM